MLLEKIPYNKITNSSCSRAAHGCFSNFYKHMDIFLCLIKIDFSESIKLWNYKKWENDVDGSWFKSGSERLSCEGSQEVLETGTRLQNFIGSRYMRGIMVFEIRDLWLTRERESRSLWSKRLKNSRLNRVSNRVREKTNRIGGKTGRDFKFLDGCQDFSTAILELWQIWL